VGYITYDLVEEEVADAIAVEFTAKADGTLRAGSSDAIEVYGRETGSGDPYTDLVATGLDMSGYTPEEDVFVDVLVVAKAIEGLKRGAVFLAVVRDVAAAGWSD
jgi:hypothetical protein